MAQERLDLSPHHLVARARGVEERRPLFRVSLERRMKEAIDLRPAV
jgi:hypothetical protein